MSTERKVIRYHPYRRPDTHEVAIRRRFLIKYFQNVRLIREPCSIPMLLNTQTLEYMTLSDDLFMKVLDFVSCAKLLSNRNSVLRILARFSYLEVLRRKRRFHPYKRPEIKTCLNSAEVRTGFVQASLAELGKMQQKEDIQKCESSYVAKINEITVEITKNSPVTKEIPPIDDATTNDHTKKDEVVAALSSNDTIPPAYEITSVEDTTTHDKTQNDEVVSALCSNDIAPTAYEITSVEDITTHDHTKKDEVVSASCSNDITKTAFEITSVEDTTTHDKTQNDEVVSASCSNDIAPTAYEITSVEDITTHDKTQNDEVVSALCCNDITQTAYEITSVEDITTHDHTKKDEVVSALSSDDISPPVYDICSFEGICSSQKDCRLPLVIENDDIQADEQGATSKDLCSSTLSKTDNDSPLVVVPLSDQLVPMQDALMDNATHTIQTKEVDNITNARQQNEEIEPFETLKLTKSFTHMPENNDSDSEIDSETEEALLRIGSDESDCELSLSETTICRLLEIDPPNEGDMKVEHLQSKSTLIVTDVDNSQSKIEATATAHITQLDEPHSNLDTNCEKMSSTECADKHISESEGNDKAPITYEIMAANDTPSNSLSDQVTIIPPATRETNIVDSDVKTTKRVNVAIQSLLTNYNMTQSTISCDTVKTVSTDTGNSLNDVESRTIMVFPDTNSFTSKEDVRTQNGTSDAEINGHLSLKEVSDPGLKAEEQCITSLISDIKKGHEKTCLNKDGHQRQLSRETKLDSCQELLTEAPTAPTVFDHMEQTSYPDTTTPVQEIKQEIFKETDLESIEAKQEEIKDKDTEQEKHKTSKLELPKQTMPKDIELWTINQARPKEMKPEVVKLAESKERKLGVIKQAQLNGKTKELPKQPKPNVLRPEKIKQTKSGQIKQKLSKQAKQNQMKPELVKQENLKELKPEEIKETQVSEIKQELPKLAKQKEMKLDIVKPAKQNMIIPEMPKEAMPKEIKPDLPKQDKQKEMIPGVVEQAKLIEIKPDMPKQAKSKENKPVLPEQAKKIQIGQELSYKAKPKKIKQEVIIQAKLKEVKQELQKLTEQKETKLPKQTKPTEIKIEQIKHVKAKDIKPEDFHQTTKNSELMKRIKPTEVKSKVMTQTKPIAINQEMFEQAKPKVINPEMIKQAKPKETIPEVIKQAKPKEIEQELIKQAKPNNIKQGLPKKGKTEEIKPALSKQAKPKDVKPELSTQAKLNEIKTELKLVKIEGDNKPKFVPIPIKFGNDNKPCNLIDRKFNLEPKSLEDKCDVMHCKAVVQKHKYRPAPLSNTSGKTDKISASHSQDGAFKQTQENDSLRCNKIEAENLKSDTSEFAKDCKLILKSDTPKPKFKPVPIKFGEDNVSFAESGPIAPKPKKFKPSQIQCVEDSRQEVSSGSITPSQKFKPVVKNYGENATPILSLNTEAVAAKLKLKPVPISFIEEKMPPANQDVLIPKLKYGTSPIKIGVDIKPSAKPEVVTPKAKFKPVLITFGEKNIPANNQRATGPKPKYKSDPVKFGEESKGLAPKTKFKPVPITFDEDGHRKIDKLCKAERVEFRKRRFASCFDQEGTSQRKIKLRY